MANAPADPPLFYERHIFLCTNVRPEGHPRGCCSAGGSEKLRGYMREKARQLGIESIRLNASGCLDRCELGPNLVIYPEGVWYHYETTQDIDEILETHVKNGGRRQKTREIASRRSQRHLKAVIARSVATKQSAEFPVAPDTIYAPATAP